MPDIAAIVRQFHTNYSNQEVEKSAPLVTDDVVADINGGAGNGVNGLTFRGRDEFIAWLQHDKIMFPDGKLVHKDLPVSGNMAAIRFYMEGTHLGPVPGPDGIIEPTGRRVHLEVTEFSTFNDEGKLVHVNTLYNTIGLLQQLTSK